MVIKITSKLSLLIAFNGNYQSVSFDTQSVWKIKYFYLLLFYFSKRSYEISNFKCTQEISVLRYPTAEKVVFAKWSHLSKCSKFKADFCKPELQIVIGESCVSDHIK